MLRLTDRPRIEVGVHRGAEKLPAYAQDLCIHITEIPFGLGLVCWGLQMLDLDLAPMAPHRAAHAISAQVYPQCPATSPFSKIARTATQAAYLGSADGSAYPRSNPFRLLSAEH